MADSPVQVNVREGELHGQAQSDNLYRPQDGVHKVHEVAVVTDHVITDANHELAVQVPEGVGASTYGHRSPLGEALARGTVEDQLADDDSDEENRQVDAETQTATTSTQEAVNTPSPDSDTPA